MFQQHPANRVTVEALAHFRRERFGQDEIFKAHAFTQGSGHPVAKLCSVLAIGLDGFTVCVQHAPHASPLQSLGGVVICGSVPHAEAAVTVGRKEALHSAQHGHDF